VLNQFYIRVLSWIPIPASIAATPTIRGELLKTSRYSTENGSKIVDRESKQHFGCFTAEKIGRHVVRR
jgi:hypothetical protein